MPAQTFRITTKQQLRMLSQVFLTLAMLPVLALFFAKISVTSFAFIVVAIGTFVIDILPALILHIHYLIKNKGDLLIINSDTKRIIYEKPPLKMAYSFDDIISMDYYRNYGKGSGWQSWSKYRYCTITFNDNTKIVITCLMINDIENTLESILQLKVVKHFKFLSFV